MPGDAGARSLPGVRSRPDDDGSSTLWPALCAPCDHDQLVRECERAIESALVLAENANANADRRVAADAERDLREAARALALGALRRHVPAGARKRSVEDVIGVLNLLEEFGDMLALADVCSAIGSLRCGAGGLDACTAHERGCPAQAPTRRYGHTPWMGVVEVGSQ